MGPAGRFSAPPQPCINPYLSKLSLKTPKTESALNALPQIDMSGMGAIAMPPALSRKQKAAVIVRLLLLEGAEFSLAKLPEEMQVELTRQMTTMRYINRDQLRDVAEEFATELEAIGLSFPGGLEGALSVLEGTIDPATTTKLRKQAGFSFTGDPWERIGDMDPERLLPIIEQESDEIAAVLLSKLKVAKAAQILGMLPGGRARRIAYAVSLTGAVEPGVVQKIGISISSQLDSLPIKAFADGPVERVGAILNFAPGATRDEVLEGLSEDDEAFAEEVRKAIFTFANIATRIDGRDVAKIIREVDQAVLITALAGAKGEGEKSVEFILSNMSQRMAGSLREEIEAVGAVKDKDAEEAANAVVAAIRELEGAGEIFLVSEDED